MSMESMNCSVEVWACAADEHGIWLIDGDAWRSPIIPSDSEPHFEVELLIAAHSERNPVLLHSTSWRPEGPTVVLTYVAVLPCDGLVLGQWPNALPVSAELLPAVGKPFVHGAAEVPVARHVDVLLHGVRHLRFLIDTDATARAALAGHWTTHLGSLQPALAGMYEDGNLQRVAAQRVCFKVDDPATAEYALGDINLGGV